MAIDGNPAAEAAPEPLAHRLRAKRKALMVDELEAVALKLFHERGVSDVTVEMIASEAHISVRTFYRHFTTKEDVLQVQIDRRSDALRAALATRPSDEDPLHSVRVALVEVVAADDQAHTRRWTEVVAANPEVLQSVLGGIVLKTQRRIAEFLAERLGTPDGSLAPTMLAGAVGGIIQAAQTHWFVSGGDLAQMISDGVALIEHGIAADRQSWSA